MLEKRIKWQVSIDNMQFSFMPGKGTTDAIFIMRQVQEKHQAKKKKLYYAFVDLENAFDRVLREVVRWALRRLGVDDVQCTICKRNGFTSGEVVCVVTCRR